MSKTSDLVHETPATPPSVRMRPPLMLGEHRRRFPIRWPLLTVLLWPHRAFDDVSYRPRPWLRLFLVTILATTPALVFTQRVDTVRLAERILEQRVRLEKRTAAEKTQQVERTAKGLKVLLPGRAGGRRMLFILLVSALAFGLLRGLNASLRFGTAVGAVVVGCAPMLLHDLIKVVQAAGADPLFLDLNNPVLSNPAAWFGLDSTRSVAGVLAKSLDVFRLWTMWLCAVGLQTVSGQRGLLASCAPWVVFLGSIGFDVLGVLLRT